LKNHKQLFDSPDIINAHVALPSGFGSIPIARELGVPLVTTVHGADLQQYIHNRLMKNQIKNVFEASDKIILNSSKLQQICTNEFGGKYNTTIVSNGIDLDEIPNTQPVEHPTESLTIISVGRLVETKGHIYVIEAIAQVEFDVRYLIVGDGPQRERLEQQANKLGIHDNVSFVGHVNHDEVYSYLKSADMFVLPSYNEAFGIAYLEAMACGLPTVACEGEGPADFISHGETGFLAPPKDSGAIVELIRELYQDSKLWRYVSDRGQRTAINTFSWKRNAERVEEILVNISKAHTQE